MVLTVDVGNSNIVLSGFESDQRIFSARLATQTSRTEDEYAILLRNVLQLHDCDPNSIRGAILATVVPSLMNVLKQAIRRICGCKVIVVTAGIKTGLNIKLDNPAVLGADLVCAAIAAKNRYPMPCIIFDMGTATTISAMDRNGCFLGGSIYPGIGVSLNALSSSTAQLTHIDADGFTGTVIGSNTIDAMRSGVLLGNAAMLDGMIVRYRQILGEDATVVVTGGLAGTILPHCFTEGIHLDESLLSDGLYMLYKLNTKSE